MPYIGDIIVIAVLVSAVFFIMRSLIRRHRRGQCSGGCSGCMGNCSGCQNMSVDQYKK